MDKTTLMPAVRKMYIVRKVPAISRIVKRKYEMLLISFLLLIFANTFTPSNLVIAKLLVTQNMLTGWFVFRNHKALKHSIGFLNLVHLLLITVGARYAYIGTIDLKHFIYITYFVIVSIEVYRQILKVKTVSREMISAVLCGFILLCMLSTFIFVQIELLHPHSFSNLQEGKANLNQLNYFSFITLLTIGYGDVVPLTLIAKRAVMATALMGHFYTVFITAIVIGKYINNRQGD